MTAATRERRIVAWVGASSYIKGHGYRVSLVEEGVRGHRPTGAWPYQGKPGTSMPWFWGDTLAEAEAACEHYNETLGISKYEACKIVTSSMFPVVP